MTARMWLVIVISVLAAQNASGQRRPWNLTAASPPEKKGAPLSGSDSESLSDADRISRLQRGIEETELKVAELKDKLGGPRSEYKKAESEFGELDRQFEESRKELHKLKESGASGVEDREAALADLHKKRALARERFDLAIAERKTIQDQVVLLEQRLQQDRDALNKLQGIADSKVSATTDVKDPGVAGSSTLPLTNSNLAGKPPAESAGEAIAQPVTAPTAGNLANPLAPAITSGSQPADSTSPAFAKPVPSEKIIKAEETATSKQAEAEEAKQQAQSITERLESIRKVIESEKELRRNARQKKDNAEATLAAVDAEVEKKWDQRNGTLPYSHPEIVKLTRELEETRARIAEVDQEITKRNETIDARNTELVNLQGEQIAALEQAKKKMEEAEAARVELAKLKNPFAPENIWRWIVNHGSKIGATILAAIILLWLIQVMEHRMVRLITRHGVTGTAEDRESRARTLAGVLQNAFTVIVVIGALLIVIAESGFNIAALLGATAVIGLAVAFGAQNLIRDYFYGFMILMENQYLVNDVVRLGSISGQVERITLRITVLRDLRGTVHFVPHGQITTVSNLTRGWARVVLDVGVAYKEDVDRVMKVLADLGKEMRRDPAYRDLILDEPEVSGVDSLGDSAVAIRFLIKTRPLKQWAIKREMLRRIKNKFDEVGIEIPFPHQVVYNRFEGTPEEQARLLGRPEPDDTEEWTTPRSAAS
jgi:moderate conductance mechanosensitive channel